MTALTADRVPASVPDTHIGLSFPRIVRSEWLKLKTLRSTWISLVLAIIVMVLAAGLIGHHMYGRLNHPGFFGGDPGEDDPIGNPLHGFGVTQLIIGVLGVLAVSGEYATGMIRATFSAVPKRLPVLAAKLTVMAIVGFVTMLIAVLASFFVAQAFLGRFSVSLTAPHAVQVIVALAGFLTLVGLLGLALGFIVRSTAGGIAGLVGILLVAPGIFAVINTSWSNTASHYLPINAGQSMFANPTYGQGDLSPTVGTIVVFAWVAAAIAGAVAVVSRRDA